MFVIDPAETDYVIKAGFPETTYIIVANFTYIFCVANITKSAFLRQNITKLVNVSGLVTKSSSYRRKYHKVGIMQMILDFMHLLLYR